MARLLKYLGENYFDDNSSLNEYRIGVEALGRSTDFDPSKNSCVRVEMHRLRTRLRKYYETEGADHPLRILLLEGRYGLRFSQAGDGSAAMAGESEEMKSSREEPEFKLPPASADAQHTLVDAVEAPKGGRVRIGSKTSVVAAMAGIALLCVLAWVWIGTLSRNRSAHTANMASSAAGGGASALITPGAAVRILAGHTNGDYIDRDGRVWGNDRDFNGGEAVTLKLPYIQGTDDPTIYRTARQGDFSYDIPVKPGKYELRLDFVETTFGPGTYTGRGESSRVFSVTLGDQPLLTALDILSDAGGNYRAFTRVLKGISPAGDGKVHLKFVRKFDQPMVNAIELVPEVGKTLNPVRIVMQENSYVDHAGQLWSSDQYAIGGVLVNHQNPAAVATDSHLFDGERFGHFTYQIPVAPGRYTVTLYFTEGFYGSVSPRHAEGDRIFDVYANGIALLRKFNIFDKAGGPNKPLTETFHGIEPDAAGLIALSFVPVKDYACISAIEVTEESQ